MVHTYHKSVNIGPRVRGSGFGTPWGSDAVRPNPAGSGYSPISNMRGYQGRPPAPRAHARPPRIRRPSSGDEGAARHGRTWARIRHPQTFTHMNGPHASTSARPTHKPDLRAAREIRQGSVSPWLSHWRERNNGPTARGGLCRCPFSPVETRSMVVVSEATTIPNPAAAQVHPKSRPPAPERVARVRPCGRTPLRALGPYGHDGTAPRSRARGTVGQNLGPTSGR